MCTERPAMMLSSVDMPLNSATFWKVRAMPWRTAWCGFIARRSTPRKTIVPFCGV